MPKKSTRNLRESRIGKRLEACKNAASTEVIVKQYRSIRVNVKNAKRWFLMKKRLSLVNDDELAAYLLDLAEPLIRRKCTNGGDWKTDRDKENDLEAIKNEDSHNVDEPLRRSPRKQCTVRVVPTEEPVTGVEMPEQSKVPQTKILPIVVAKNHESRVEKRRTRIKHHHKTKEKHHKRAKRKHSRNEKIDEPKSSSRDDDISSRINAERHDDEILRKHGISLSCVPKMIIENLSISEMHQPIKNTNDDQENSLLVENLNKRRKITSERRKIRRNAEKEIKFEKTIDSQTNYENSQQVNDKAINDNKRAERLKNREIEEEAETTRRIEDNRGKKRRKHGKDLSLDKREEKMVAGDDKMETIRKRRKKKHKRTSSTNHRTSKCHDVRKAPQDGIVEKSDIVDEIVDKSEQPIREILSVETNVVQSRMDIEEISAAEIPERLAIKIKLCLDCNDRHIKDSCPLTSTNRRVMDRLTFEDWCTRHKKNTDVTRAIAIDDPMSEGYAVTNGDNEESDEETASTKEQTRNKTKIDGEDKQLRVNDDRPLYSRESLPDCLELRITTSLEHGIGIYAIDSLPIYAKFGPLVGTPIREMDIPDDFSMRHIWEIEKDGKTSYISTTNPVKSNWIRYMRPADTKEDRNVTVVTKNGELYLVTTQEITKGMELTYWADSQSSAWTRKNKVDKTNCGGCNLNFTHPIYYRLHCCIFHDTRYSLTIRKYHCKVCGAAVLGKENIMKHAADLHGGRGAYQCQYCRKFFLRLNYLEMHRTYGCSQNPQRARPLCDFCGRKFCQPQKLKVHIKRMHSEMSEVLREFQCKMCMKLLGSRAALQRHMKEVHHKDVVGAATCDRCGKMFQNKSNLKIHMLTHSGVKPFKCKENDCKAAFTTKQCLQFHYKKVHGLSEDMMPKIERSVAYTFDAYSGGLVEDMNRDEKTSGSDRRGSQQENSNSVMSLDDCSSEHSSRADSTFQPTMSGAVSTSRYNLDRYILDRDGQEMQDSDLHDREIREMQEREMQEREMQEHEMQEREIQEREMQEREMQEREMLEREEQEDREMQERREQQENCEMQESSSPLPTNSHEDIQLSTTESSLENERPSPDVDFYGTRLQSKGSKKWMGQFSNIAESEIVAHQHNPTRSDVYDFDETSIKKDEDRNDSMALMTSSKLGLNIYRRPESTNASLLVEAALDAAERDIGAVTSPILDSNDRDSSIYSISGQLRENDSNLDSYMQQQEDLVSRSSIGTENRKSPPSHVQIDYHRPIDYINSPRTHGIEQYLPQDDLPRVGSPLGYNIHMQHLASPSANQNRYQEIHHQQQLHHQVPTDNLSSDKGDSVAQNLSISVKEKTLQLDLSTSYKYEQLDADFSRDRTNFEPLVLSSGELQGLDMSARGFHHGLGGHITNTRYHHHLYEITAERQSVDLSRNAGYPISPPPSTAPSTTIPPPYSHSEVLRIVSLDLTPGHSVDLSLSRSHHLHSSGTRIINCSPPPSGTSHVVPDTAEGRILASPPPTITGYSANYPVSPAAYHPPRPGYHHYSGYY